MNQKGLHPMIQMNVRIEQKTKEQVEKLAREDRRTLSDYVRLVLEEHCEREKWGR